MPLPGGLFAGDEELGKKDDDHRPSADGSSPWTWTTPNGTPRWRRKRVFVLIGAIIFLYYFFKNMPTDLTPAARRVDNREPSRTLNGSPATQAGSKTKKPAIAAAAGAAKDMFSAVIGTSEEATGAYNGPIKYYNLAESLHGIARTNGYREINQNVLFAVSSTQSASRLIPLACDMSRWNRNHVHFAFMGNDDIPMKNLKTLNGVGAECQIYWHDARPDYASTSTEARMELSVKGGFDHFQNFMHPQVVLTDGGTVENTYFIRAVRSRTSHYGRPHIELPPDAVQRLMWLTRLDSGSLGAWHNTYIDILIQAPATLSGSLVRLLKSIQRADYTGFRHPRLTIELSETIPQATQEYLDGIVWPPIDPSGAPHVSGVTLRHRISSAPLTPLESSIRFLESFYPARPTNSHVLVLSSNVELSPLYFHYLMYNLLEYRHSSYGGQMRDATDLMGLSLSLPAHYLNGTTAFEPPKPSSPEDSPTAFRWQAPNPSASLIFGDKWLEFHSFLTLRLSAALKGLRPHEKLVTTKLPAWTEFALELMRARGYSILYPQLPKKRSVATIHKELYEIPEEFLEQKSKARSDTLSAPPKLPDDLFLEAPIAPSPSAAPSARESVLTAIPLSSLLPYNADLPELVSLPSLSYTGESLDSLSSSEKSFEYMQTFRHSIGGCKVNTYPESIRNSASDLFCWGTSDEDPELAASLKHLDTSSKTSPVDPENVDEYDPEAISNTEGSLQDDPKAPIQKAGRITYATQDDPIKQEHAITNSRDRYTPVDPDSDPSSAANAVRYNGRGGNYAGSTIDPATGRMIRLETPEQKEKKRLAKERAMKKEFELHLARQARGAGTQG